MGRAGHLERGLCVACSAAAAEHNSTGGDTDRFRARIDSRSEQDSTAEAIDWRQRRDFVDGCLDCGGIIFVSRWLDGSFDGDGWESHAAAHVASVREVHDSVAGGGCFIDEFSVGVWMNPLAGGQLGRHGIQARRTDRDCDQWRQKVRGALWRDHLSSLFSPYPDVQL